MVPICSALCVPHCTIIVVYLPSANSGYNQITIGTGKHTSAGLETSILRSMSSHDLL